MPSKRQDDWHGLSSDRIALFFYNTMQVVKSLVSNYVMVVLSTVESFAFNWSETTTSTSTIIYTIAYELKYNRDHWLIYHPMVLLTCIELIYLQINPIINLSVHFSMIYIDKHNTYYWYFNAHPITHPFHNTLLKLNIGRYNLHLNCPYRVLWMSTVRNAWSQSRGI